MIKDLEIQLEKQQDMRKCVRMGNNIMCSII